MKLLIITPIHNEERNIGVLARQLRMSSLLPALWVVVDDGSTDNSVAELKNVNLPFPSQILRRANQGGLIGGSAFSAWQYGIDTVSNAYESFDYIMKLDADVDLAPNYLASVVDGFRTRPDVALVGGALVGSRDREQNLHVPGPVKMYSSSVLQRLDTLPRAVGFDVMDEVAITSMGYTVEVVKDLPVRVRRPIGASQGRIHGRRRNGQVCRWVGYSLPYFLLHVMRYALRPPKVLGSVAMIWGYIGAGEGPYPPHLKRDHARSQRAKLRQAVRNPVSWVREVYREPKGTEVS